jgi:hypothetical protein
LDDFTTDELRNIQVIAAGTRLEQAAVYLDLRQRERGAWTATGDMVTDAKDRFVAKKETDYVTWNRLLAVTTPARLDRQG